MKYGTRYYTNEVSELKKHLGDIPEQTCPDIDKIISMLEELRQDNARLRELGAEWYKFADEMADTAEELQDKLEEVEKERDELYEECEELKKQLTN